MQRSDRTRPILFALSALIALLSGCSAMTLDQQIIGQWKGQLDLANKSESNPFAQFANQTFEPTINFKEDKTFAMTVGVLPVEGTWSASDHKITLVVTKISGQGKVDFKKRAAHELSRNPLASQFDVDKVDQPIVLDVALDAKTLRTGDIAKNLSALGPLAPSGTVFFKRLGASD